LLEERLATVLAAKVKIEKESRVISGVLVGQTENLERLQLEVDSKKLFLVMSLCS